MRLKVYTGNQIQTVTDVNGMLKINVFLELKRQMQVESIMARIGRGNIKELCDEVEKAGSGS